ncbi:hypothetical protein KAZ57_04175 [Patescibacteria group bacterium]|nr:hypothetical protein [Patescibacteria group bacterium]
MNNDTMQNTLESLADIYPPPEYQATRERIPVTESEKFCLEQAFLPALKKTLALKPLIGRHDLFGYQDDIELPEITVKTLANDPLLKELAGRDEVLRRFIQLKQDAHEDSIRSSEPPSRLINPHKVNRALTIYAPVNYVLKMQDGDFALKLFGEETRDKLAEQLKRINHYMTARKIDRRPVRDEYIQTLFEIGTQVYEKLNTIELEPSEKE